MRLFWWFALMIYPLLGASLAIALAFLVHPLAVLIPLILPIVLFLREANRRDEVLVSLADGVELSTERQDKAIDDFVGLVKKDKD